VSGEVARFQEPRTKFQEENQEPNFKKVFGDWFFGIWFLVLPEGWDLVLGIWSFRLWLHANTIRIVLASASACVAERSFAMIVARAWMV
jgi:hypothetical protein